MQIPYVPGTVMPYHMLSGSAFGLFVPMLNATGGLSLSQVCSITGLEGSTIQNWVKRGLVARPIDKKYFERQLARILLINSLRDSMQLDRIAALLRYLNGLVEDESDDIISEAQLYDYLCGIIAKTNQSGSFSQEKISEAVRDEIGDYEGPLPDSRSKLCKGLTVMTVACISGMMHSAADMLLNELIN